MKNASPLAYLFSKMWRYSEGNRRNVVLFWTMFVVSESIDLFGQPLIWAKIMNTIQQEGITPKSISTLTGLLLLTLITAVLMWCFHGPGRLIERANAFRIRVNYRKYLLKGIMTLPMEWHVNHHSGDTIDRIEKGSSSLFEFTEDSFEVIYAIVRLIGSFVMLAYFSPPAAYIVLTMVLVSSWVTIRFDRVMMAYYQELSRSENRISEGIFDAISNITTVVILRVERLVFDAIVRKIEKPFDLFKTANRTNELKWFLISLLCSVMTVAVLSVYFWQHLGAGGGILIGNIYLLIRYLDKINELFFKFTWMYGDIVKRKSRVMNAEELAKDFKRENFANHVLPPNWQCIAVANLNFSYHGDGDGNLDLENVSLTFRRSERIAFVGASGSGKTTFLKVMRDLYHPQSLSLSVDGRNIPEGFAGISRAIALVPQNPEIFATTILENITLGAEYHMEFVRHFTDMACFTEVAECLPQKFVSSIKEKGVNLSGGQQQRLALARGLLACHNKSIVLLDEPTSSVDTANEMRIYANIFREFTDKTIISAIHRLHLLPLFDRMYFFGSGRIIASGTLTELLDISPEFRILWAEYSQSVSEHNAAD